MEFKREIFFRNKKEEKSQGENDFVFDLENCDLNDERILKYLEDLKENNLGEYYHILERLADLDILKRPEEEDSLVLLKDIYSDEVDEEKDAPSDEYYNRFNKFRNQPKPNDNKSKRNISRIPSINPYK